MRAYTKSQSKARIILIESNKSICTFSTVLVLQHRGGHFSPSCDRLIDPCSLRTVKILSVQDLISSFQAIKAL